MGRRKEPIEKMATRAKGDGKTLGGREVAVAARSVPVRTGVPDPPVVFSGRGASEWENIWRAGFWLKDDQDYHWIEMICRAYQDIAIFRQQVEEDGLVVTGYAGQMTAHPLIKEIRDCEKTIQKCLSVLGFSPTDRAKLAINTQKAQSALQDMIDDANAQ